MICARLDGETQWEYDLRTEFGIASLVDSFCPAEGCLRKVVDALKDSCRRAAEDRDESAGGYNRAISPERCGKGPGRARIVCAARGYDAPSFARRLGGPLPASAAMLLATRDQAAAQLSGGLSVKQGETITPNSDSTHRRCPCMATVPPMMACRSTNSWPWTRGGA
jgi:hypothetical protein